MISNHFGGIEVNSPNLSKPEADLIELRSRRGRSEISYRFEVVWGTSLLGNPAHPAPSQPLYQATPPACRISRSSLHAATREKFNFVGLASDQFQFRPTRSIFDDMAVAVQQLSIPAHELVYERQQLPKLRSNHGPCVDASSVGWMQETSIDTPLEEMQRRFNTDGYVFIKHLIPRETVLDSREEYFAHLAPTHILKPGTPPRDGIFNDADDPETHNGVGATRLPDGVDRLDLLESAHVLPKYDGLLKHDSLHSFVRRFMGWRNDVLLTRTLLRWVGTTLRILMMC